jgi:hypothetical protein
MASTLSSALSSALCTYALEVPKEIQQPRDFESIQTDVPTEVDSLSEKALDLSRLRGYHLPR